MKKEKRVIRSLMVLFMSVIFIGVQPVTQVLAADTDYIDNWEDYAAENNYSTTSGEYTWTAVVDGIEQVLEAGKACFEAGDYDAARQAGSDAYYNFYETSGMERYTNGISGSRVSEVELSFKTVRKIAKKMNDSGEGSYEDYASEVENLKTMLREDANSFDGVSGSVDSSSDATTSDGSSSSSAAAVTFGACFLILLREGFEAILIVGAIIAYLVKSAGADEEKKKKTVCPVYIGSLLGIVLSFVLAWLLNLLKLANTASQEAIEGVTALLAVCVLYYVSNWMLSKSESDAWNTYIKDKTRKASERGSYFALAFTAFLAVFREGAEVVLFYQPYMGTDNTSSAVAGFVFGAIALVFVYLLINLLSLRIPLKPFFVGTSILMFLMSISFLGAGIKELMEGDIITSITSPSWLQWIPYTDVLDVLGIYPILETLIPQLVLLAVTIVIFIVTTRKNNRIHAEAEARRAEERRAAEIAQKEKEEREFKHRILLILQEGLAAEKEGKLDELIASVLNCNDSLK
jgi:high-affinity iron transporter